jgi:hypothetical protein
MIVLLLWIAALIIGVAASNLNWMWKWLFALELWVIHKWGKIEEL